MACESLGPPNIFVSIPVVLFHVGKMIQTPYIELKSGFGQLNVGESDECHS